MNDLVRSALTEPLIHLASRWQSVTRPSRRRASGAAVVLALVLAPLGARAGSLSARGAAWAALALTLAATLAWALFDAHRSRDARRLLRGSMASRASETPRDRDRADRALRALSFLGPDGRVSVAGVSPVLAQAHVERALNDLPSDGILDRAARLAGRVAVAALIVGLGALSLGLTHVGSLLEGSDVLLARGGVAPFTMRWLDGVEVTVRPPEYVHQSSFVSFGRQPLLVPYGSVLAVTGTPLRPGQRLVLGNGVTEVELVDDGSGGLVARWTVTGDDKLRIVARFGDVVIPEAQDLPVSSLPDTAPEVSVEGAPRTLTLLDATDDIPIRYEAADDHGLREVDLVLRSAAREERRVLTRLDGETRTDRGGLTLKLRDAFLTKSHAPVEVTVEAKDNDPLTGPKWGASAAITVIPPAIGESEALRLDGLRKLRDALVDTLSWRLGNARPVDAAGRKALAAQDRKRSDDDEALSSDVLSVMHAGIRAPQRVRALIVAKERQLDAALDAEVRSPSDDARIAVVKATESFVLVVDAAVRGLAVHDARGIARQLSDVADDLALGARQMQGQMQDGASTDAGHARSRIDASLQMLKSGATSIGKFGSIGHDLGETIESDLSRFKRASDAPDFVHAELVARDLSARLHQPDPSFGSRSASPRAGGESGGASGTAGDDDGEASDEVDQAFEAARQDLERLAQEHAGKMASLQQALDAAASSEQSKETLEEDRRRAEAIREAAQGLPHSGSGSDSWTSKGASARELAEQMAGSLEAGRHAEAGRAGRDAVAALDQADKMLQSGGWYEDPGRTGKRAIARARAELQSQLEWAEQQASHDTQGTAERASKEVEQAGADEGDIADRAHDLARKSRDTGALPDDATDAIDEASRAAREASEALKRGDVEKGKDRERAVQRDLEAAGQHLGDDGDEPSSQPTGPEGPKGGVGGQVDIPNRGGPGPGQEDLRRRILRGLGSGSSGPWRDAVERYAQGLLR